MGTYNPDISNKIQKVLDSCKCQEQLVYCENMVDNFLNTVENQDEKRELRTKYYTLIKIKRTELFL